MEEAFRNLYTMTRTELLDEFRKEARLGTRQGLNLTDLKEFTYWLHKRRVNYWDPARVAYDTPPRHPPPRSASRKPLIQSVSSNSNKSLAGACARHPERIQGVWF